MKKCPSGAEFLRVVERPEGLMGMAESEGGYRERRNEELQRALAGRVDTNPAPPATDLVTLSEVARLRQSVNELHGSLRDLRRLVRFLVEQVPGEETKSE